jgi:hypothetical protein
MFSLHYKYFPGADRTAILEHEPGIPAGYVQHGDDQSPIHLYVIVGSPDGWDLGYGLRGRLDRDGRRPLRWRDVDRVVRSEVLTDGGQLIAQARE